MTEFKKNGLVIHEQDIGENDKLLIILTERYGKVSVIVKGGKSIRNRHISCCQLFAYASFDLRKKGNYYYIVDSDLIESYYSIRTDVVKLSLASFICDVVNDVCQEGNNEDAILKLTLNTLFAIAENVKELEFIRACFEMRIASELGFTPSLEECSICGEKSLTNVTIDLIDGVATCKKCSSNISANVENVFVDHNMQKPIAIVSEAVVQAIRYITKCKPERFLSFNLPQDELISLYDVCERFLLHQLERSFYSLEFYKMML